MVPAGRAALAYQTARVDAAARHVLHIDASGGKSCAAGQTAAAFFGEFPVACKAASEVQRVALWDAELRRKLFYGPEHAEAKELILAGRGGGAEAQLLAPIEDFAAQLASARGLVVSVPAWRGGVPWVVRQYCDSVVHEGLVFKDDRGSRVGVLGNGRPLLVIVAGCSDPEQSQAVDWIVEQFGAAGFDNAAVLAAPAAAGSGTVPLAAQRFGRALDAAVAAEAAGAGRPAARDQRRCWDSDGLIGWVQSQGGLSEDCVESLRAARVDGDLFRQATEDDWQGEELAIEGPDLARVLELQRIFAETICSAAAGLGPSSDR